MIEVLISIAVISIMWSTFFQAVQFAVSQNHETKLRLKACQDIRYLFETLSITEASKQRESVVHWLTQTQHPNLYYQIVAENEGWKVTFNMVGQAEQIHLNDITYGS